MNNKLDNLWMKAKNLKYNLSDYQIGKFYLM